MGKLVANSSWYLLGSHSQQEIGQSKGTSLSGSHAHISGPKVCACSCLLHSFLEGFLSGDLAKALRSANSNAAFCQAGLPIPAHASSKIYKSNMSVGPSTIFWPIQSNVAVSISSQFLAAWSRNEHPLYLSFLTFPKKGKFFSTDFSPLRTKSYTECGEMTQEVARMAHNLLKLRFLWSIGPNFKRLGGGRFTMGRFGAKPAKPSDLTAHALLGAYMRLPAHYLRWLVEAPGWLAWLQVHIWYHLQWSCHTPQVPDSGERKAFSKSGSIQLVTGCFWPGLRKVNFIVVDLQASSWESSWLDLLWGSLTAIVLTGNDLRQINSHSLRWHIPRQHASMNIVMFSLY